MKQKYIYILIFFLCAYVSTGSAQDKHKHGNFDIDKFKKERADFVTKEAGLTQKEAAQFIPLMDELSEKRFELNRNVRAESRKLRDNNNKADADYERLINIGLESGEKEALLNKEYYSKFRKILSAEKIYKSRKAEEDFMKQTINKSRKNRSEKK